MAVITPTFDDGNGDMRTITWAAITTADTGLKVNIEGLENMLVHVIGGGTAQMPGSNDGTNFVNIGPGLAANSLNAITTFPKYIDFGTIATDTVTIILSGRRNRR